MTAVGGLFSLPLTVTAPPRLLARLGHRGPSLRLSHLKEALGQEAGRQGHSLETGRTLGALEGRLESAHTGDREAIVSVCLLPSWFPMVRVIFGACSGRGRARDPHSRHSAPSHPLRSGKATAGWSEGTAPSGKCVWGADREGGRVGRGGPDGGVGFSCSQRETGGHRYYCSAGRGGPGMRGARQDL